MMTTTPPEAPQDDDATCCTCFKCWPEYGLFRVCPTCGNKRCPKATDCALACTDSNEPGQPGSRYATIPTDLARLTAERDDLRGLVEAAAHTFSDSLDHIGVQERLKAAIVWNGQPNREQP